MILGLVFLHLSCHPCGKGIIRYHGEVDLQLLDVDGQELLAKTVLSTGESWRTDVPLSVSMNPTWLGGVIEDAGLEWLGPDESTVCAASHTTDGAPFEGLEVCESAPDQVWVNVMLGADGRVSGGAVGLWNSTEGATELGYVESTTATIEDDMTGSLRAGLVGGCSAVAELALSWRFDRDACASYGTSGGGFGF